MSDHYRIRTGTVLAYQSSANEQNRTALLVQMTGLEPAASPSQAESSTKLSYIWMFWLAQITAKM